MPKLLQINVVSNILSTGKIAEDIAKVAIVKGWESFIAYGRGSKPGVSTEIRIGNNLDIYKHYVYHRIFDKEGLGSVKATQKLIFRIKNINPDIIQLHNIHDHYIKYPILFQFLKDFNRTVVWVQHDCWAFTGGCMYFDQIACNKWQTTCDNCPIKKSIGKNRSKEHFLLKRELLDSIDSLTFVPVSFWLGDLMRKSVQNHRLIKVIHNGIDINLFKISSKLGNKDEYFHILGVAAVWSSRKGFDDFIHLRQLLPDRYKITLVGLSQKQISKLPTGICGISRTTNVQELVKLYNDADVFVNPTYSDNFPTTNIEALACGTPVITYNTGGSPEAIDEKTGIVVPQGDVYALAEAIKHMAVNPLSSDECRKRAEEHFDKEKCFSKYISLYEELLENK